MCAVLQVVHNINKDVSYSSPPHIHTSKAQVSGDLRDDLIPIFSLKVSVLNHGLFEVVAAV